MHSGAAGCLLNHSTCQVCDFCCSVVSLSSKVKLILPRRFIKHREEEAKQRQCVGSRQGLKYSQLVKWWSDVFWQPIVYHCLWTCKKHSSKQVKFAHVKKIFIFIVTEVFRENNVDKLCTIKLFQFWEVNTSVNGWTHFKVHLVAVMELFIISHNFCQLMMAFADVLMKIMSSNQKFQNSYWMSF